MNKRSSTSINVNLRFYGDLRDFLYKNQDGKTLVRSLPEPTSVKDLIEGCGVPHTEVDLILVDQNPVDFANRITGGEEVSVYPFFKSGRIDPPERMLNPDVQHSSFVVDVNLGKLARYLRIAGFDTAYQNDLNDEKLVDIMLDEDRIVLTRDHKLLMRNVVTSGYLPRSDHPAYQLEEVFIRFNLFDKIQPYTRCVNCNGALEKVEKEKIIDQLEPLTKKYFHNFSTCPVCGQVYWRGSHRSRLHPNVLKLIQPGL